MLTIDLLGELTLRRDGRVLALPKSRKTRALLGLLAHAPRPHRRERLCEMLWDVPDDPRGALRWSLSKLRGLVDEPGFTRLVADRETVRLEPIDTTIDVAAITADLAGGLAPLTVERLEEIAARFHGEFLDGLDIGACPEFSAWRLAEREAIRRLHRDVLAELGRRLAEQPDRALPHLRALTASEPLDEAAHAALVRALMRAGRTREAEAQAELARRFLLGTATSGEIDRALAPVAVQPAAPERAQTTPRKPGRPPAIAVPPFEIPGNDPEQRAFADGITQNVITELARFRPLFTVVARYVFQVGGGERSARGEADTSAAYTLDGTVRQAGSRIRVVVNLVELDGRTSVWSERFDRELGDVFHIQDDVTAKIVGALAGRIGALEADRARRKPVAALDAYDCLLLGMDALDHYTQDDHRLARAMYVRARELDPDGARPLAGLAATHIYDWFLGDDPIELEKAQGLAQEALARDPDDAWNTMVAGRVLLHRRRFGQAEHTYAQAIALNPHDADIWASRGYLLTCLGRADEGVDSVHHAIELDPYHRVWFWENLGNARFVQRRYDEALVAFRKVPDPPAYVLAYAAACLVRLGRADEARAMTAQALALDPSQSRHRHRRGQPFANPGDVEDFIDALATAGFPEGRDLPIAS